MDGVAAMAKALASPHCRLRSLTLLEQAGVTFSDSHVEHILDAMASNSTLLKVTWRVESRKSFALNKV